MDDEFSLYKLEVSVVGNPQTFVCSHKVGHAFSVVGENLVFPEKACAKRPAAPAPGKAALYPSE